VASLAKTPTEDIEPLLHNQNKAPGRSTLKRPVGNKERNAVTAIIELILFQPQLAMLIENPAELDDIPVAGTEFLRQLVELVHNRPQLTCAGLIENWRGTRFETRLREIAASSADRTSELTEPDQELLDALDGLRQVRTRQLRQQMTSVVRMSDLSEADKQQLRNPKGRQKTPVDK
jgi:DNA primase